MRQALLHVRRASAVVALAVLGLACGLIGACGPGLDPHAPHAPGTLMCAEGQLPCAEQVRNLRCTSLTAGMLPPDIDQVRWMLRGAKVPQRQAPPVSLTSWCSGTLDVEGVQVPIELFQNIEGGFLQPEGTDRIWFQTPPEESETIEARTCVGFPLPAPETIAVGACESVSATPAPDLAALQRIVGSAKRVDRTTFGTEEPVPWAACETRIGAERRRIDLFAGHKGVIRLPNERRLCFAW